MVALRVHGHIYGQIIGDGGQAPPVALLGDQWPSAPPVPTPLDESQAVTRKALVLSPSKRETVLGRRRIHTHSPI